MMLDDQNKPPRIPVRKGDRWLVLILGTVAIATFWGLGMRFSDSQEWGDSSAMVLMVRLLETMGVIFLLGILVAFFRYNKFEEALFRHLYKLLLILGIIILVLIFSR